MRKLLYGLTVVTLWGFSPSGAFAHSYGPAPRVTGAPGDNPRACTQCHATSALNSGSGGIKLILPSGSVYLPGVKQRVTIEVTDPNQRRWGFELTARLNSDLEKAQAGDFTPVDSQTQVICEDYGPKPCATGVSFVTHTSAGSRNGTRNGATFQVDWTPPSTNAGPITLYVAGNAANGDGTPTGDLIYTSNVQLTPAIPATPSVTSGRIVSSGTYAAGPVAPNSWVSVFGTNLSATTRAATEADYVDGGLPFSLDGVSVLLFGAPRLAYIGYVSPTQVNFLLPSDLTPANVNVQVRNPAGISGNIALTVQANAAQLFTSDGNKILGRHANGASLSAVPATPGETIVIYATGCGPTTPALIPGQIPTDAFTLTALPTVTIGGAPATVVSGSVVPGAAGVYQISVQVPSGAANGDLPLTVQVGTATPLSAVLSVQK